MGTMRDAFERAWAKAGLTVEETVQKQGERKARPVLHINRNNFSGSSQNAPAAGDAPDAFVGRKRRNRRAKKSSRAKAHPVPLDWAGIDTRLSTALAKSRPPPRQPSAAELASIYGTRAADDVATRSQGGSSRAREHPPPEQATLHLGPNARVVWSSNGQQAPLLDQSIEDRGIALEDVAGSPAAPRELVLGVDFGSSSTKVVVCDRAAGRSLAVAAVDIAGIRRYLLPSAIRACNGRYTLGGDGVLHANLKSALLASPADVGCQERVTAYLALVIRRARGWLFATHADIYRDIPIVWTLTVGIPKRQGETGLHINLYQKLAMAAWHVAGEAGPVTSGGVTEALRQADASPQGDGSVEVRVIPEIAAEIYGFVSSESFDPRGTNIYLMVDVGGKTLDASLFYVKRGNANRWSFSFFTSEVYRLGAIELHRARIDWWMTMLRTEASGVDVSQLIADLGAMKRMSMFEEAIPANIDNYVDGVTLGPAPEDERAPDDLFRANVSMAVRRKAFESAVDVQVPASQMMGIPFFLCGGGSRMTLYSATVQQAMMRRGSSPFYAVPRLLRIPTDLKAPGVDESTYDRLAVAYGLGRVDIADVIDAEPLPILRPVDDSYREQFISKDMC